MGENPNSSQLPNQLATKRTTTIFFLLPKSHFGNRNPSQIPTQMTTKRTATIFFLLPKPHFQNLNPNPRSIWSMAKDPALESALARNRRWIVNNQIKNLLLRSPNQISTVRSLQKKFKTLDLQGKAQNWLQKYPCCFTTFKDLNNNETLFGFSKRMAALVEEEEVTKTLTEPLMVKRLAKILMLARDRKLNVVKLNELKKSFGLTEDYILRVVLKNPEFFRLVNCAGRRSSMEIELLKWDEDLAISAVELAAIEKGMEPRFSCSLPLSWIRSREKFEEFNARSRYVSPYVEDWRESCDVDSEKRVVGMVHELLSLTLWKKASILKLEHFRREFGLLETERLNCLLLRHPCIFYVSNRYKIYTVVLREGYKGSELVEKYPMVVVKEKFGELMQDGLHEYNRRRCAANLEKKRKRGEVALKVKREEKEEEESDRVEKREERKRFYKVLFDENP